MLKTYVIWPEGSPQEAVFARGWLRMTWTMFVMGWGELFQFMPRRITRFWDFTDFAGEKPSDVAHYVEKAMVRLKALGKPPE